MIRVLIADDHKMFAEGLSGALASVPDLNIVGVVGDGHEVAPAVTAHSPDVLLVDLEMPTMGGLEVLGCGGIRSSDDRRHDACLQ
jgi:DNA-binding NarL/FixJ family response regulator